MTRRLQFEIGRAAALAHYPDAGVPTDATISIFRGTTPIVNEASCSIDAYDEVFSGAHVGDRVLTVSAAPTVGERYWMTDEYGTGQEVRCVGGAPTSFVLDDELLRPIASGRLQGYRISYTLGAQHTAHTARRLRVRWSYTVDGQPVTASELIDVVPWPFDINITQRDIEAADPSFQSRAGRYGQWRGLLGRAIDDVWGWLTGKQIEPDLVRDRDLLKPIAIWRFLQLCTIGEDRTFADFGALLKEAQTSFASSRAWYDSDDDLVRDADGHSGGAISYPVTGGQAGVAEGRETLGTPIRRLRVG